MPTKPRDKGPWKGPSHHRNKSTKARPVATAKPRTYTKQVAGTFRREQPFDYFLVIDFECTCEMEDNSWPHEIIEFPVVLMKADTGEFVAEFHRYVRPVLRPILTPFCKNLTGIQQATVDAAEPLPVVVKELQRWLDLTIPPGATVCCATDGPTDMEKFMYRYAVKRDGVPFPELLFTYVDVKLSFNKFFRTKTKLKLPVMLRELGLKVEGQLHSGIDDTRNIARLMDAMMNKGCVFKYPIYIRHSSDAADTEAIVAKAGGSDDDDSGASSIGSGDAEDDREGDLEPEEAQEAQDQGDAAAAGPSGAEHESNDADPENAESGGDVDGNSEVTPGSGGASPSKTRPRVILQKRNLDSDARTSAALLRRQKISATLATEDDMRALRDLSRSSTEKRPMNKHWPLVVLVAVLLASLANLYAAFLW